MLLTASEMVLKPCSWESPAWIALREMHQACHAALSAPPLNAHARGYVRLLVLSPSPCTCCRPDVAPAAIQARG